MITTPASAELIKYASNAFLATKVSFINEIADLCEVCEADIAQVSYGMSLDLRIGNRFLQVGPGYGGSCFPKDISALSQLFKAHDFNNPIIDAVMASNLRRKERLVKRVVEILDHSVQDKVIACLGVSFKKNTDDIRESASIEILQQLLAKGAVLRIYDPKAMDNAKTILRQQNISWGNSVADAASGACALLILTEWDEFVEVDYQQIAIAHIIDYRNILLSNKLHQNTKYHRLGAV
jgi:UDPglucose 6-dehydrogenase